jgi:general secretion pathway protein C
MLIWAINLLLILWIAYQLTQLIRLFRYETDIQEVPQTDPAPEVQRPVPAFQVSARELAKMHLFGTPTIKQAAIKDAPIDAPETRLKLVLNGTISSSDSRLMHAIITDASGNAESYTVGDLIPGGIMVHEILADRVILFRSQRYETLPLPRDDVRNILASSDPASIKEADLRSGSTSSPSIRKPPVSLDDLVSPQPVHVDGKFAGFSLKPGKDPQLLGKLGLQHGDVITWINEVYLDNPLKGMQALHRISSGDYVNMNLRRDGQEISLSFYMP